MLVDRQFHFATAVMDELLFSVVVVARAEGAGAHMLFPSPSGGAAWLHFRPPLFSATHTGLRWTDFLEVGWSNSTTA